MEFIDYIQMDLLVLVPLLFVIGLFLKKLPIFTMEWLIPIILWVLGVALSILYLAIELNHGLSAGTMLVGFIQGTFVAATSVFGNEIVKQVVIKRIEDSRQS